MRRHAALKRNEPPPPPPPPPRRRWVGDSGCVIGSGQCCSTCSLRWRRAAPCPAPAQPSPNCRLVVSPPLPPFPAEAWWCRSTLATWTSASEPGSPPSICPPSRRCRWGSPALPYSHAPCEPCYGDALPAHYAFPPAMHSPHACGQPSDVNAPPHRHAVAGAALRLAVEWRVWGSGLTLKGAHISTFRPLPCPCSSSSSELSSSFFLWPARLSRLVVTVQLIGTRIAPS